MPEGTLHLRPVYSGEQIRAAERTLLDAGQGPALMRRAAHGLAQHIAGLLAPRVYGAEVTGLIGAGNNGGDGLFSLAFLARRGVQARAVLVRDSAHAAGLSAFLEAGGRLTEAVPGTTTVLLDAVLGTGFRGMFTMPEIPGLAELLDTHDDAAAQSPLVVACDLPSGVNADTGAAGESVLRADHTVSFGGLKQGLLAGRGGLLSGQLYSVDIGLGAHLPTTPVQCTVDPAPASVPESDTASAGQVSSLQRRRPVHRPRPAADAHKYSRGVVHILAGSPGFPGAAQLTAAAAVSTGIGMVRLQAPAAVRGPVIAAWPEVVGVPEDSISAAADRTGCVVVGPGIGDKEADLQRAGAVLEQVLEDGTLCVLDASALGLVRDQLKRRGGLNKNVLITPHVGEARALAAAMRDQMLVKMLGTNAASADPVEAARRIAGRLDCTVLLKGPNTVIASEQGEVILHRAQAPGLATAGSGDVLSGVLGAVAAAAPAAAPGPEWRQLAARAVQMHSQAAHRIDPGGCGGFGASQLITGLSAGAGRG